MAKPILYYIDWSPPSRAVQLTAKTLGVDLEIKIISLLDGDHLKPEFLKVKQNKKKKKLILTDFKFSR